MASVRWLAAAAVVTLGACGGDDSGSAPDTIAVATSAPPATSTTTTTTSTAPTTSTIAPTTTQAPPKDCAGAPQFDPAGALREQFVDYLVGCGFSPSDGGCLFDNLDFDDPRVTAGEPGAMVPAFEACGIDASRIVEIGGS